MRNSLLQISGATLITFAFFTQTSCARRASASSSNQALFEKAAESLDSEMEGAKNDGLPQNDTELFGVAPSASENAALAYHAVTVELGKHWNAYVTLGRIKGPPGSSAWNNAARSLPQVDETLGKLQAAASLPKAWTGPEKNFSSELKQLSKALCAKARLEVHEGNLAGAMQTLETVWKLGDHSGMEPTMPGFINSVGVKRMACWTAEAIITDTKADKAVLLDLRNTFSKLTSAPDAQRAFRGVYVNFLDIYKPILNDSDAIKDNLEDVNDPRIFVQGVDEKTLIRGYLTRGIRLCRQVDKVMGDKKTTSREKGSQLLATYEAEWTQDDTFRLSRDTLENPDVALLLPMVETWRKLLLNSISILLDNPPLGHLPQGAVPDMDPYTGKPFMYTPIPSGFRLASQGVQAINPRIPDSMVPTSSHVFYYPSNL